MLVDFNLLKEEVQFLELDLASLRIVNRQILPKALLGVRGFGTPGRTFKISDDFTRIACIANDSGRHQLSVLDIGTHETKILDSNIRVNVPIISSDFGFPPFEWISNSQILYQHMPGEEDLRNGLYVFRIIDIKTATSSECFRKTLPMAFDGGSFAVNPLNGRLIYNRKYLMDTDKKTLTDKDAPYAVMSEGENNNTEIRLASELLYSGNTKCYETWLSGSGKYFAYLLTPYGNPEAGAYAVFRANSKPLKIGEGLYQNQIIGWIE